MSLLVLLGPGARTPGKVTLSDAPMTTVTVADAAVTATVVVSDAPVAVVVVSDALAP